MKRKGAPRRSQAQGRQCRPTATRPSRGRIRKKPTTKTRGHCSAPPKPTYFSLLRDVENYLKVEHVEGASMQKLKREMEKKYGGRAFDVASCKMLRSAVRRLQNKKRIKKHPNSTLLKFTPPVAPAYNLFAAGASKPGVRVVPLRHPPPIRKHVVPLRKPPSTSAKKTSRPLQSHRPRPIQKRRYH